MHGAAQSGWAWSTVVGAMVAAVVAVVGFMINGARDRRARRRELYAEAYRTALALVEFVYRARRGDPANRRILADRYHQIHEDINFHRGWIEIESRYMGRAYTTLIMRVRHATGASTHEAWEYLRRGDVESTEWWPFVGTHGHPDVGFAREQFIRDVRDHFSLAGYDRLWRRYNDRAWEALRGEFPSEQGGTFANP